MAFKSMRLTIYSMYIQLEVCFLFFGVNRIPDGCAGLPNVPKPLLNACGANNPPFAKQQSQNHFKIGFFHT